MRKSIIFILVLSISIFSLLPSYATSGERVYAVNGGWSVSYGAALSPTSNLMDKPIIDVPASRNNYINFYNESVRIPSGHSTIYGRFLVSSPTGDIQANQFAAQVKNIIVGNISSTMRYYDGYLYFSVSGGFKRDASSTGFIIQVYETFTGAFSLQLDYCYIRTNSFVSLSATSYGSPISALTGAESTKVHGIDVEFSGNNFSGEIDKGNVFYISVDVPISSSQLVLDSAFFQSSFEISSGIALDLHVYDDMGNVYAADMQTTSDYTDTVTNIYSNYSFFVSGEHDNIIDWSTSYTGPYPDGNYVEYRGQMYADIWEVETFHQKVIDQYIYDETISVSPTSSALVTCDLSGYPDSASVLTVRLTILSNGGIYAPVVYLPSCGVFLNPADANLGENAGVISSIKAFFENGISAIVSALTFGWNRLENAINGQDTSDADDFADSMETKAEELEDLADDLSAVTTPDVEQIDFDISDIVSSEDMASGAAILTSSFDNSFVSSLLVLVFTFALAGFVLYGKLG